MDHASCNGRPCVLSSLLAALTLLLSPTHARRSPRGAHGTSVDAEQAARDQSQQEGAQSWTAAYSGLTQ